MLLRAATCDYFHDPLRFEFFYINLLLSKMSMTISRDKGELFKLLVLFDHKFRTQRYSVYNDLKQKKEANYRK